MTPPDAEALYAQLLTRVRAVLEAEPATRLVGIATGGAWIAERLHADLKQPGACGVVSSVMHRDDFARRGLASSVQTQLPFEVDGASLLLIDDVLYTGRTLRAVLNELFDHGRPASVRLAVLVDRGGRQLPIEAQLSMAHVEVPAGQSLELARDGDGRLRFVLESQT
ncbi:bifunctional pyr operon transcriptional regulator/uracil phosphoribosyltransferase PyrR [Hydrogenophaga sp. YM1]|uniref:bifunctional pyr operon transcriptional regulator/uracil phosphoribosyltransferase PyrR n=1 Tax=Hydrogenophaga TaxID=47420 RepID=UPI000878803F|nr:MULTISPECIES: bifunctional pyr operon transcriptional regulator/uracil phosphoribosyltransferase PyrR [unclassified Hydrogenophaga]MBN9369720.1 bifunctional pyr operon transcriptional regulator/uracil phosphoribosyltransferase PyrR [Hydrogenophaga sp.]OJV57433.1 MAG: bifunctional pyr operon transcriptional regulator/uracil phosphoribosyltransferase [Hydrogenophaga sp. 70-12]QRR33303.1 bifunctional pyr operon transcriptional regulator/uracil phosphoribosyltransferase PyrR [Hydrogenophaga sp. Y